VELDQINWDRNVIANELGALKQRNADLQRELADREAERANAEARLQQQTAAMVWRCWGCALLVP
jgi:uncharacterized metal-binding protein